MENSKSLLVEWFESLSPWFSKKSNVSRDFWMPDSSCNFCYDCETPFTIFIRRHHCRLCGRVFCSRCSMNSLPVPVGSGDNSGAFQWIRVCECCYMEEKEQQNPTFSCSSPSTEDSSTRLTSNSIRCSEQHPTNGSSFDGRRRISSYTYKEDTLTVTSMDSVSDIEDPSLENRCLMNSDNDYGIYRADSRLLHDQYGQNESDKTDCDLFLHVTQPLEDVNTNIFPSTVEKSLNLQALIGSEKNIHDGLDNYQSEPSTPTHNAGETSSDLMDFENCALFLPPPPANAADEKIMNTYEDYYDDDNESYEAGDFAFSHLTVNLSSSGIDGHGIAMKEVVVGHFRALVSQLLQAENLPIDEEHDKESWLNIITSLSWEVATLLKPDMSEEGEMDPGASVKIKCIACGHRSDSFVVKGVVCKKNLAHRRMRSRIEKPRLLILGGALEYHRVSNHLSSFDTLLQQEMDHLKMSVAKIDAHHPDVLLVENTVSRYAQDYLLAKGISVVLNMKRSFLDRVARCTGAQIVSSIDYLSSQKLGNCDLFYLEKFFEEHDCAGYKKQMKNLMFFEGCPKPLGCTILLMGANNNELKKVKHVLQYGVFAAYHLALETSFLADEGAAIPEHPSKSLITVSLPDKPSIGDSISTVPRNMVPTSDTEIDNKVLTSESDLLSDCISTTECTLPPISCNNENADTIENSSSFSSFINLQDPDQNNVDPNDLLQLQISVPASNSFFSSTDLSIPSHKYLKETNRIGNDSKETIITTGHVNGDDFLDTINFKKLSVDPDVYMHSAPHFVEENTCEEQIEMDFGTLSENNADLQEQEPLLREDFPTLSSDHQSIVVSLSIRCVWTGTVCEQAHLFRIKYYGSFDKPLGRYLREHLFEESYLCLSCEKPSEAHVHCYTHSQGSLTISVRKNPEILAGKEDGKIWMWHTCLRCPQKDRKLQQTSRIIMSDAAWGLSFGKFLELSFSSHAAASRIAGCGHSIHRDCLRFYGFGRMVACFRYASIDVHSVHLPPSIINFNTNVPEWIQKEVDEATIRFSQLLRVISQSSEKMPNARSNENHLDLQRMFQEEKTEFEEYLKQMKESPFFDTLGINELNRRMLLFSYLWDKRLIYSSGLDHNSCVQLNSSSEEDTRHTCEAQSYPSSTSSPSHHLDQSSGISHRCSSEGQMSKFSDISDNVGAKWISDDVPLFIDNEKSDSSTSVERAHTFGGFEGQLEEHSQFVENRYLTQTNIGQCADSSSWIAEPFSSFYNGIFQKNTVDVSFFKDLYNYRPIYVSKFWGLHNHVGARFIFPCSSVYPDILIYDDEPSSIVSYALISEGYQSLLSIEQEKEAKERQKEEAKRKKDASFPSSDSKGPILSSDKALDTVKDGHKNYTISEAGSHSCAETESQPPINSNIRHLKVSFRDEGPYEKVRYSVTLYCAMQFDALRKLCCAKEDEFLSSLSRCKKWGAQGGKSNVFFAKTLDDRFIIKQVTKIELESFFEFSPKYFKYLSESIKNKSPTCLAKILGIYQISIKHTKGSKDSKMDVLVMENLLYQRNITRVYDLKGSLRSRYNSDSSGNNKVLLDQNLVETLPTSPIFVENKAKRLLERAVWNDTSFLASIDVMDYSLLVGVDETRHELVVGVIDFMRKYTWDKHLETWAKASGILGGAKNASPTVISPMQYKRRFRKAMAAYFVMVPDQWSSPTLGSTADPMEDNKHQNSPKS